MAKLGGLIRGQDVAFDTHQAGDGQPVHLEDLHIEKRLHDKRGKVRFPFFGDREPSYSGRMTGCTFDRIVREVREALRRNPELAQDLAKTVVNQVRRFGNGEATVANAMEAARKIAGYFDLNGEFANRVELYAQERLVRFVTQHVSDDTGQRVEIIQSARSVSIRRARSRFVAYLPR